MDYLEIKELTRTFRKNPTQAEATLWKQLRRRKLEGKRFLRQYAIIYRIYNHHWFFYVPDFYCHEKRLIIEVDGKIHDTQIEKDHRRDENLKRLGYTTLRIKNEELLDMDATLDKIRGYLL
jgi:very-short-patch-repair endonuclease